MKKLSLIFSILCICGSSIAQDFDHAVGIRLGAVSGITYKKFANDIDAKQLIITFQRAGIQLTILKQYYEPVFLQISDKLFFHYGYGGHLGFSTLGNEIYLINNQQYRKKELSFGLGINGIIGIEYHFVKIPMAISLDYKPYFEVNIPFIFVNDPTDLSVNLSYTF